MSVRLRLRRQGRKGQPFYHIVAADERVARDGKFLEKVGTYNPTANPAVIEVDHDKAIKWLKNGAQPQTVLNKLYKHTQLEDTFHYNMVALVDLLRGRAAPSRILEL